MQTLRDLYLHEAVERLDRARHRRTRAPGDEGPRRSVAHAAARLAGRVLLALGAHLLAFGGEHARPIIVGYTPPPSSYSQN